MAVFVVKTKLGQNKEICAQNQETPSWLNVCRGSDGPTCSEVFLLTQGPLAGQTRLVSQSPVSIYSIWTGVIRVRSRHTNRTRLLVLVHLQHHFKSTPSGLSEQEHFIYRDQPTCQRRHAHTHTHRAHVHWVTHVHWVSEDIKCSSVNALWRFQTSTDQLQGLARGIAIKQKNK